MQKLTPGTGNYQQEVIDYLGAIQNALNHQVLSGHPTLAIGTASKKAVKYAAVTALVDGVCVAVSASEKAFTATTHDIPASASAVQEAVYLLSVNSAAALTLTMGAIASGAGNALIPDCPEGQTALGYVRIAVAEGATPFDASSDDLDAVHITDTYVSLGGNAAFVGRMDEAWAPGGVKAE